MRHEAPQSRALLGAGLVREVGSTVSKSECRAPFLDRMERTKRSVPGVRKWLRFEAGGRCGTLHADKYNITEETGVQVNASLAGLGLVLVSLIDWLTFLSCMSRQAVSC